MLLESAYFSSIVERSYESFANEVVSCGTACKGFLVLAVLDHGAANYVSIPYPYEESYICARRSLSAFSVLYGIDDTPNSCLH